MTSQGSPYARLRRALLTGNLTIIDAAAREVPVVPLPDALRIVALLGAKGDPRFSRAAARWAGRVLREQPPGSLRELERMVDLLCALEQDPGHEIALRPYVT